MGRLKGDRMHQICERSFEYPDFEYFIGNVKREDYSGWFRLCVSYDNYVIADLMRKMGYDINNDNRIVDDIVFYVERGFKEKIAYLIQCGLVIDYLMMDKIIGSFTDYRYLHSDDSILNQIKLVYRGQKLVKILGKCQKNRVSLY